MALQPSSPGKCDWESVIGEMKKQIHREEALNSTMKSWLASRQLATSRSLPKAAQPANKKSQAHYNLSELLASAKHVQQAGAQVANQTGPDSLSANSPAFSAQRISDTQVPASDVEAARPELQGQAILAEMAAACSMSAIAARRVAKIVVQIATQQGGADVMEKIAHKQDTARSAASASAIAGSRGLAVERLLQELEALSPTSYSPPGLTVPSLNAPLELPLPRFLRPQSCDAPKPRGGQGPLPKVMASSVSPPQPLFDQFSGWDTCQKCSSNCIQTTTPLWLCGDDVTIQYRMSL